MTTPRPSSLLVDDAPDALSALHMALEMRFLASTTQTKRRAALREGMGFVGLPRCPHGQMATLFVEGIAHASPSLPLAPSRLVAGSGMDLAQRVAEGAFRPDLSYALAVAGLSVPRLRTRRGDVAVRVADGTLKDRGDLTEMRILRETLTCQRWKKEPGGGRTGAVPRWPSRQAEQI